MRLALETQQASSSGVAAAEAVEAVEWTWKPFDCV